MRIRIIYIALLIKISVFINAQNYIPNDFGYNRIDSAICDNQIKRLSFINDYDTTEYFIEFEYNYQNKRIVRKTSGYLKTRIPFGEYITKNSSNNTIYSMNFDTLHIGYKEIRKIAAENLLDPDTIKVYYGHTLEFLTLPYEGYWIILLESRNYSLSNFSEQDKLLINSITGSVEKTTTHINYQPVYIQKNSIAPIFIGGKTELGNYLKENSKIDIAENGRNWVDVNFNVTKTGSVENVSINCTNSTYHNNEAIRLVKSMPNWTPALDKNGSKVETDWEIRISFK